MSRVQRHVKVARWLAESDATGKACGCGGLHEHEAIRLDQVHMQGDGLSWTLDGQDDLQLDRVADNLRIQLKCVAGCALAILPPVPACPAQGGGADGHRKPAAYRVPRHFHDQASPTAPLLSRAA